MKNPSQIGMAKSLKSFADKYRKPSTAIDISKTPQKEIDTLKNKPTAAYKKFFDKHYGKGAAELVLGKP